MANDVAWFKSGGLKPQAPTLPFVPRTFKSVVSRPCDWSLLVLDMRTRGALLMKTDGKIDEQQGVWGMGQKPSKVSLLGR